MNSKFYCNKECEYFPCHEIKDKENFNCLFCYCPLFALGDKCGGNFSYNKHGKKDCSGCSIPHDPKNYEYIIERCSKVMDLTKRENKKKILIWSAVMALIAFAACIFLPLQALRNLWRIAEPVGFGDITPILMQLKETALTPGYVPAAICAAVVFAVAYLLRGHKVLAGILAFFIILAGLILSLLAVESNAVPFGIIVKILIEYVQLGAI